MEARAELIEASINAAAKQGTSSAKKLLAVSNEEGVVSLLNAEKQTSEHDYGASDRARATIIPELTGDRLRLAEDDPLAAQECSV